MLPNVFELLSTNSSVATLVSSRIYRAGRAPQNSTAPYVTWMVISGIPENSLSDAPLIDRWELQIDCWGNNEGTGESEVESLALAVRDALEVDHYITDVGMMERDPDTRRYRVSIQVSWWEARDNIAPSV